MIPADVIPDGTVLVMAVPVAHPREIGTAWAIHAMQGDGALPSLNALAAIHLEIGDLIGRRLQAADAAIDAGTLAGGEITPADLEFARHMRATDAAQAKLAADLGGAA